MEAQAAQSAERGTVLQEALADEVAAKATAELKAGLVPLSLRTPRLSLLAFLLQENIQPFTGSKTAAVCITFN